MPISGVGVKPDGTLGWVDAQGNEVNPDGSPIPGAQQLRPLQAPTKTTPGQARPAPITPQPASTLNIDPTAGARPPTATQQAQTTATQAGQQAPSIGQPLGAGGMFTVDQATAAAAAEVQQANLNVAASWEQVQAAQKAVNDLQSTNDPVKIQQQLPSLTSTLDTAYNTLSSAEQRVQTANAAYSQSLGKAIDQNLVDPSQVQLAQSQASKADADAQTARAQSQVLTDGAPGQRALVAAQAGAQSASAAAQQATADATRAKTPAEVQQLQAQASALTAQANQTNALLPGLVQKQQAETGLTQAQTGLTGSQSALAQAQAGQSQANTGLINAQAAQQRAETQGLLPAQIGQVQAQAGLAGAQGTNQLASAAGQLATVQQNLQGSLYGLQDRVNAIRAIQQQVFGPGGSGDPTEANDLLNQFVTSSIAGTTPYAANVAAANAGLTAFGTQASMYNAAQQALASRANALAGLGGNVLSTLGQMNANAPKGSTAMAGAFQNVIDYLANKTAAQQQAGVPGGMPQQPTPPALPPLLQRLAGQAPTGAAGAPLPTSPPGAAAGAPTAPQPQTSAPVTINIGAGQNPSPGPAQQAQFPQSTPQNQQMPAALQQYAPPTTDFVHQLWGNELQSGAVQSPYNQGPGPGTPAAGSLYY